MRAGVAGLCLRALDLRNILLFKLAVKIEEIVLVAIVLLIRLNKISLLVEQCGCVVV